jgi:hypothetical protein
LSTTISFLLCEILFNWSALLKAMKLSIKPCG